MKIKIYTIDFQLPRWAKRSVVAVISGVALVGIAFIVRAAPTVTIHTFLPNETLTASNLNGNFTALKDAIETMTISAPSVTAGTFGAGVFIPASQVSGTVASATNATNATYASNAAAGSALAAAIAKVPVVIQTEPVLTKVAAGGWNEGLATCTEGVPIAVSCKDNTLSPPMTLSRAEVVKGTSNVRCGFNNPGGVEQNFHTSAICLVFKAP